MKNSTFEQSLKHVQNNITITLEAFSNSRVKTSLQEAINYALFNSGKKYRPFLLWAAGMPLQAKEKSCFQIGAVLEMLHTYSLVHDDLPVMDNDDVRHGKPALHKQYNEGLAVLAGDALLTDAFYFLTYQEIKEKAETKLKIVHLISEYLGSTGMILGQVLDINNSNNTNLVHLLKTAKFMELATVLGGILGNTDSAMIDILSIVGQNIGLAFQIIDDIKDFNTDKGYNICKEIGIEAARLKADSLINEVVNTLNCQEIDFIALKQLAAVLQHSLSTTI